MHDLCVCSDVGLQKKKTYELLKSVRLLLLAAADHDHLLVARALVEVYGATGTSAASNDGRTAKQVGKNSRQQHLSLWYSDAAAAAAARALLD